ncbi:hypothetical protein CI109_102821 [Kwoniella shandongensis]|uniref:Protein kinase domain-containing protein n=1 Tax=Kwoniella shandongensis TaxID=1734106 RepID=A0A5M6C7X9_9TREE|nr:uncharacterized protein CI109_000012 [Kwoniella shandongensis]KAA5531174.1 hypothetical protein CI109_000012 [Kwoniella shandongensis]
MVVTALETLDLHRDGPSITGRVTLDSPPLSPSTFDQGPKAGWTSSRTIPPTPTSPTSPGSQDRGDNPAQDRNHHHNHHHHHHHQYNDTEDENQAGPSNHSSSRNVIPPPPNPRRHRSGILMSRVRAASSGASIKLGSNASASKSHGDLASISMGMSFTSATPNRIPADKDDVGDDDYEEELEQDSMTGIARRRFRSSSREGWKRVVSEGQKLEAQDDGEDRFWDNSARYYHHIHSRPVSRSNSISNSPEHSPGLHRRNQTSPQSSPIFVRRNLTLPQNGPGPPTAPPGAGMSASLSPNHHFLQSHLPPTFPHSGSSPEASPSDHNLPAAMVFTPTTQEWKDLQATPEWQELHHKAIGKSSDVEHSFSGSSSEDEGRRSSEGSAHSIMSSMLLHPEGSAGDQLHHHHSHRKVSSKPSLRTAVSAEYLGAEAQHTPDPGSPILTPADDVPGSPRRPTFNSIVIAPSPIMPVQEKVTTPLESPTKGNDSPTLAASLDEQEAKHLDQLSNYHSGPFDDDSVIADGDHDSPVRFASIGRRDSLRAVKKEGDRPVGPRTKTKRELEREKLLQMVDEELEVDQGGLGGGFGWGGGVQEIGMGLGMAPRPSVADIRIDSTDMVARPGSADPILGNSGQNKESSNPFEHHFAQQTKSTTLPLGPSKTTNLSPTQPFKPSPLNASPVTAAENLPTSSSANTSPTETPNVDTPAATPASPAVPPPTSVLASIRDYARTLVSQHSQDKPAKAKEASPPMSPRSPRRRDTNRVSLVAGRIVQPFTIPPNTSLPPPALSITTAVDKEKSNPSLQSFSPFRSSPNLSTTRLPGGRVEMPSFSRLDSTISLAPSTGAPSECGTPTDETAGGIGGRGIADYVILKEAGKGAYGLVMRAKVKGPKGEPVGDEVIIKYIIKARILADCWKKHKVLGPIPVEIHVMDQLRHLLYHRPTKRLPWDPTRPHTASGTPPPSIRGDSNDQSAPNTPESGRSVQSNDSAIGLYNPTQKYIAAEIKSSPERGHPNICKLLDFFEDKEFYYLVMPRYGTGMDLFDRVESQPSGLEPFEVRSLIGQLADAVRFLHANGIVHRDIKDENVILDGQGRCQLIDFGSAAHWRPGKRWDTFSGTLHYASPEILRGEMYGGKEQDVWALGVVGYVLLVGETPFSDLPDEVLEGLSEESRANAALVARCSSGEGKMDEGKEEDGGGRLEDAADLVRRCLELEAGDRPTAEWLVEHRYLKGGDGWVGRRGWEGRVLGRG